MNHKELVAKWNEGADEYNQWDNLGEDEKVIFAYKTGMERASTMARKEANEWEMHLENAADSEDYLMTVGREAALTEFVDTITEELKNEHSTTESHS